MDKEGLNKLHIDYLHERGHNHGSKAEGEAIAIEMESLVDFLAAAKPSRGVAGFLSCPACGEGVTTAPFPPPPEGNHPRRAGPPAPPGGPPRTPGRRRGGPSRPTPAPRSGGRAPRAGGPRGTPPGRARTRS